jgi:protein MpaA
MPHGSSVIFRLEGCQNKRDNARVQENAAREIYAPLARLAAASDFLVSSPVSTEGSRIERYIFEGPSGGGDPLRIGFFAGIHGDEQAGSRAVVELATELVRNPNVAEGYNLYMYPVCNPTGFESGSRCSASGKDLNREFWKNSAEPEVRLLEKEIHDHAFHGLVSFHADDTSDGLYGFVRGALLAKSLLEPALSAAEVVLPRNRNLVIDGFTAENGIISQCYDGILTSPPKLQGSPFEIILETPHSAPENAQMRAFLLATLSILAEYRKFISFAADL